MASTALPLPAEGPRPLRSLNILHDLPQVADLIELCFKTTLDDDGQSYVQQMRRASADGAFLNWASRIMESSSMPLAGYVWEEDGKIIGNASLVFQVHRGRRLAMIANVATHPSFRGRGIGRALAERAMLGALQRGAKDIWLQVRHDNPTAIRIYTELGFVERARRTTYQSGNSAGSGSRGTDSARSTRSAGAQRVVATSRQPSRQQWPRQYEWLRRAHPDEISWYAHWEWNRLEPSLKNLLYRLFMQSEQRQWCATGDQDLLATATWVPTYRVPNSLWLAAAPDSGVAATRVLEIARQELSQYRKITIEHPAGELKEEIEAAGFSEFRTLLWMRATEDGVLRIQNKKET